MKRNEIRIPAFEDIIFAGRNKEYGAYDLRKRYKSAAIFSILCGIIFCAGTFILLTSFGTKDGIVEPDSETIIVLTPDNLIDPNKIIPPETVKPVNIPVQNRNVVPDVTSDTSIVTRDLPITDEIILTTRNGNVNDTTSIYHEQPAGVIPPESPKIFIKVEEMPEFPGGDEALLNFIAKNTVYPEEALKNNIQGRVTLKFVVNTDGAVDRIEIIGSVDPLLDNEAIRVIGLLPKFRPGKQGGVPVPVWFTVPVNFQLINY